MINCVLIDDEPKNIRILKQLLAEFCPQTAFAGAASDTEEAESLIRRTQPDLVFLDIQLPGENAFDLLDRLPSARFEVVFVTAYHEYSLRAFRYAALDYLLKPVNIHELTAAVDKAAELLRLRDANCRVNSLLANLRTPQVTAHKIALPNAENLTFISVDDIIRCEANGGYTIFFLKNGEKILSCRTIKEYEDILPADYFLRIHDRHIVNVLYVKRYFKGRGGYIEMEDQATVEVSTRRKNNFLSRFGL